MKMKSMKWNYTKEVSKMLDYVNISRNLVKKLARLSLSYADKYHLQIGQGTELPASTSIALSHGKGGTPLYYSSIMMHYAA
jgi:hypothetical protein